MAYNKKKHLEENLKAIRIAFGNPDFITPEERETLYRYSGFGGLKCVLNPAERESDIER